MAVNGRLPTQLLASVNGQLVTRPTADAWNRMVSAAADVKLGLWVTAGGGYRDIEAQRQLWLAGSASGIAVAKPGYQTHGWGDRIDVGKFGPNWGAEGIRRERWLLAHAPGFGFTREFGSIDPNHFKYTPVKTSTQPKDDDMRLYHKFVGTGTTWAVGGPGIWWAIGLQTTANNAAVAFGSSTLLNSAQWDLAHDVCLSGTAPGELTDEQVVDDAELGQALTSAVSLILDGTQAQITQAVADINQHTDEDFAEQFV